MVASRRICQSKLRDFRPFQWSPQGGSANQRQAISDYFNGRLEEDLPIKVKRFQTISMVASRRICQSKLSDFRPFQWSPLGGSANQRGVVELERRSGTVSFHEK
ncbi:hypothetical protein AVEN_205581-1 [Araneus ventricosus]|uniref:Uncharacterized protein n=1 Tax=Araneus ventricosus TaxID=182803 RepID=A0A4Y2F8Z7_ARAVE|nr:hypothetical protein AVEN_205581-1 [Araneus ventricosus]